MTSAEWLRPDPLAVAKFDAASRPVERPRTPEGYYVIRRDGELAVCVCGSTRFQFKRGRDVCAVCNVTEEAR